MKKLLILLLTLAVIGALQTVYAQGPTFDLRASLVQPLNAEMSLTQNNSYYTYQFLDETTAIRIINEVVYETTYTNEAKSGKNFEIGMNLDLGKNWNIRTGLGVNLIHFRSTQSTSISQVIRSVPMDTIDLSFPTVNNTPYCDQTINSYSDVIETISEGTLTEVVSLRVPIAFSYQLLQSKFNVGAGLYLQTPLWSSRTRQYINIHRETIDDENICEYVAITDIDKTGNNINNLQIGWNTWMSYKILQNLSIEIGVMKNMSNIFVGIENRYDPLSLSIGVRYDLNNNQTAASATSMDHSSE